MKILVIEDSEILCRNIVRYLSKRNIEVHISLDGKDGLYKASINTYDAIILDINLPEINGMDICKHLREKGKTTPIIMLTSKSTNSDVIAGLGIGADDYLTKPFEYSILLARIEAITRRDLKNKSTTKIKLNSGVEIDFEKHEITQNGEVVILSNIEYNLIKFLAQNKGKALGRLEIYHSVWGESDNDFVYSKTMDVHIGQIRKKFGKDFIQTRKGYGYIIE